MAWDSTRISVDTINKFISKIEMNVISRTRLLALLKQRGRILMGANESGQQLDWLVEYARGSRTERADGAELALSSFNAPQRRKKALLDWGKIESFEKVTKGEMLKAQGQQARVKILQDAITKMGSDLKHFLVSDLWDDGTRVGPEDPVYGLTSVLGKVETPTDQYPTPAAATTYAGLSMGLGGLGGSVEEGAWPNGKFTPEYYAWTPLQANYEHADWGGASADWASNCGKVLRRLIDFQADLRGDDGEVDVFLMTGLMYSEFKDNQEAKQRFNVTQPGKKGLISLGFNDVINYDGVEVSRDPAVPSEYGVGLHLDGLTLRSMQSKLFDSKNEFWMTAKTQLLTTDFWGQFQINPWQLCAAVPDPTADATTTTA